MPNNVLFTFTHQLYYKGTHSTILIRLPVHLKRNETVRENGLCNHGLRTVLVRSEMPPIPAKLSAVRFRNWPTNRLKKASRTGHSTRSPWPGLALVLFVFNAFALQLQNRLQARISDSECVGVATGSRGSSFVDCRRSTSSPKKIPKKIIIFMLAVKDFYTFSNNNKYRLASNSTPHTYTRTYTHTHTHTDTHCSVGVGVGE